MVTPPRDGSGASAEPAALAGRQSTHGVGSAASGARAAGAGAGAGAGSSTSNEALRRGMLTGVLQRVRARLANTPDADEGLGDQQHSRGTTTPSKPTKHN